MNSESKVRYINSIVAVACMKNITADGENIKVDLRCA